MLHIQLTEKKTVHLLATTGNKNNHLTKPLILLNLSMRQLSKVAVHFQAADCPRRDATQFQGSEYTESQQTSMATENDPFIDGLPIIVHYKNYVIFYSYVKLPEGNRYT